MQRLAAIAHNIGVKKKIRQRKLSNVWAVVVERRPELLMRPRGRLHWERGVDDRAARAIAHVGDWAALDQYIDNHWDDLRAEVAPRQQEAQSLQQQAGGPYPMLNKDWLSWFGEHGHELKAAMAAVSATRAEFAHRLFEEDGALPHALIW